jgi:DNA-binding IclR family transcriptional regulator
MGTVAKALELLDHFTRANPRIGLSDLARMADLNKATCYRLASALCDHGLLEQLGDSREYRLGSGVLRLASLREAHVPTRDAAMPALTRLAAETGETAHLSILLRGQLRPLAHAYSSAHVTRVTMEDTDVLPLHATSSGLAVLAFGSADLRVSVLASGLPRLTAATLTNPGVLLARIKHAQTIGYAESEGGFAAEVHSLAAPLFDRAGICTGALAVAALATRMGGAERDRIRTALLRAAREITQLWGGHLPPSLSQSWQNADELLTQGTTP